MSARFARHGVNGMRAMLVIAGLGMTLGVSASAQRASSSDEWCQREDWGDDRQGFCEVREYTVPAAGAVLTVDAAPNGGIQVEGSPRGDILVRARIVGTARTEEDARAIVGQVQIVATADRVNADGPRGLGRREGWQVSYRLAVPTATPLALRTTNGGITVDSIDSKVELRTVNGGIKLSRMAGEVEGRTTNGGVDVELEGRTWQGTGLDVQTTNGGVKLEIPDGYSAHLEAGTTNGRVSVDFPVTVYGRMGRSLSSDIGGGGPTLRVQTSNGGIKILRK